MSVHPVDLFLWVMLLLLAVVAFVKAADRRREGRGRAALGNLALGTAALLLAVYVLALAFKAAAIAGLQGG